MKIHFKLILYVILVLQPSIDVSIAQQNITSDNFNKILDPLKVNNSIHEKYKKGRIFTRLTGTMEDEPHWSNQFGPYGITGTYALDVDLNNENVIFCGTNVALVRSIDGGNTYDVFDSDFPIKDVKIDPNDNNKVFVVGESGSIFISTDLGQTWKNTRPTYGDWFSYWSEIGISPHNSNLVLIGANDPSEHLLRSSDGGSTWQSFVVNGIGRLSFIKFHPSNPNKIYIGGENGVFSSTDSGSTWQKITQGLPNSTFIYYSGMAFKPSDDNIVFLVCANSGSTNQVFMSEDGGIIWSNISNKFPSYDYFWTIDFSKWNVNEIFLGGFYATYKVSIPSLQSETVFQNDSVEKLVTTDNKIFFATRHNGLYSSNDKGITFQETNGDLSFADIRAVKFNPQNPAVVVAVGWTGGVFRTSNGGNEWILQWSNGHWNSVDVCESNADIYYVCGVEGVLKSIDGGVTFNYIYYSGGEQFIKIKCNPVDANHAILLSHVGATYTASQTFDGGQNWLPINDIPGNTSVSRAHSIIFDPVNSGNIFICTDNGIYKSQNSGQSWELLTETHINDMNYFVDENNDLHIYGIYNDRC